MSALDMSRLASAAPGQGAQQIGAGAPSCNTAQGSSVLVTPDAQLHASANDAETAAFIQRSFLGNGAQPAPNAAPLPREAAQQAHAPQSQSPTAHASRSHESTAHSQANAGSPARDTAPVTLRDGVSRALQRDSMETSSERAAHGEYDDTTRSTTSDDDLRGVTRGSARVTPRALEERAPGAPAQGDFWSRVVSTQHALQQHPQCPAGEALGLAIAWAVAASGLEPAPTGRGAVAGKPGGAPAASASHVGRATSARADAPSSVDLQQWVSHLHSDLSERASRALVVAWEQRGSALRAVTYDKG